MHIYIVYDGDLENEHNRIALTIGLNVILIDLGHFFKLSGDKDVCERYVVQSQINWLNCHFKT